MMFFQVRSLYNFPWWPSSTNFKKWAFGKTMENLTEETNLQTSNNEIFFISIFIFIFYFLIEIKCCPVQIIMWNLKPKSLTFQRYHCSRLFWALRGIFLGPSQKSSGQELTHYRLLFLTHVILDLLNTNQVELNWHTILYCFYTYTTSMNVNFDGSFSNYENWFLKLWNVETIELIYVLWSLPLLLLSSESTFKILSSENTFEIKYFLLKSIRDLSLWLSLHCSIFPSNLWTWKEKEEKYQSTHLPYFYRSGYFTRIQVKFSYL